MSVIAMQKRKIMIKIVINMMTKAAKIRWHRRAYCEGCGYYSDNDNADDYEETGDSYDQVK